MTLTSQLAQIKDAVARQFAGVIASGDLVIDGGVYNCRPMRPQPGGISHVAYSEHAWLNAWDLYYGTRPRKYVDAVVSWLKAEKAAGRLPVGSIITYGSGGGHVHIEGAPKRNPKPWINIPPCVTGQQQPDGEDPIMIEDIQKNLNVAGFRDYDERTLVQDGVWGPRTASAHAKMAEAASASRGGISGDHYHEGGRTGRTVWA